MLGSYFAALPSGSTPFASTSPGQAISDLRALLGRLSVTDALLYRTHYLRRGHARSVAWYMLVILARNFFLCHRDLQARGASLGEILRAGEWWSSSFMDYMDQDALEGAAVLEAHFAASDDEDA